MLKYQRGKGLGLMIAVTWVARGVKEASFACRSQEWLVTKGKTQIEHKY